MCQLLLFTAGAKASGCSVACWDHGSFSLASSSQHLMTAHHLIYRFRCSLTGAIFCIFPGYILSRSCGAPGCLLLIHGNVKLAVLAAVEALLPQQLASSVSWQAYAMCDLEAMAILSWSCSCSQQLVA